MRKCDPRWNHDKEVAPSTPQQAISVMCRYVGNEAYGLITTISSPKTDNVAYACGFRKQIFIALKKVVSWSNQIVSDMCFKSSCTVCQLAPSTCMPAISSSRDLKELVLQGHVVLRLKSDAGAEDVGESRTLLGKSIDNRGARRSERSLEHVAEDTEHAVEVVELAIAAFGSVGLPLNTGHHLSDKNQIDDQR